VTPIRDRGGRKIAPIQGAGEIMGIRDEVLVPSGDVRVAILKFPREDGQKNQEKAFAA